MKIRFSVLQALACITILSLLTFAWVSHYKYRNAQIENRSLQQRLAIESERLKLTERALLIQMKDALAKPAAPFSAHGIAKEVVQRIAIEYPNDPYIWWVLIQTGALYDGIPIEDAVGMLGPATNQSNPKYMEWFETGVRCPTKIRASFDGKKLGNWRMAHEFYE